MDTIVRDRRPPLIGEERRRRILEVLARRGAVQVSELTKAFGYSEATLRRDLQRLENEGRLRRAHGGAVDVGDSAELELPPNDKAILQVAEKQAIAAAAAQLVRPGEVIALNGGTTTLELARKLKTIGDLLGHRSAESTCVYLRLDVDELRDVALDLPATRRTGGHP